jgi:predicted metal-dependent hydrolase
MKDDLLGYIIIIFILFICYRLYLDSDFFHLKCIISDINGKKYCVRERKNMEQASDLLAKTSEKMIKLIHYLEDKYKENEFVDRLVRRFNPNKIVEILPNSEYTAYSENKGKKLAFCLNIEKKEDNNLIDENTLMFVALHEMTHIGTKSLGHKEEFWNNFKFMIKEASDCGIYTLVDYSKENKTYCSMAIKDNPYFDL